MYKRPVGVFAVCSHNLEALWICLNGKTPSFSFQSKAAVAGQSDIPLKEEEFEIAETTGLLPSKERGLHGGWSQLSKMREICGQEVFTLNTRVRNRSLESVLATWNPFRQPEGSGVCVCVWCTHHLGFSWGRITPFSMILQVEGCGAFWSIAND